MRFSFKRSFGPFCSLALTPTPLTRFCFFLFFFFFCSLLFKLSPQSERLQQAKCFSVLLSLFFKTLFSYLNNQLLEAQLAKGFYGSLVIEIFWKARDDNKLFFQKGLLARLVASRHLFILAKEYKKENCSAQRSLGRRKVTSLRAFFLP